MTGGLAFLFPGQGTQRPGMADRLLRVHPPARLLFEEAADLLGFDLAALCRRGPEAVLRATEHAQPALFVTGCGYAAFLRGSGAVPSATAGHSVGELCALVVAGVLAFGDGVELVATRGRLMAAAPPGGMASVLGLPVDEVADLVAAADDTDGPVVVAIVNGPADVVVSGARAGVERVADDAAGRAGARASVLRVAGAFHSPLMAPVVPEWEAAVAAVELSEPSLPIALNADGRLAGAASAVRRALTETLTAPVRWDGCMAAVRAVGARTGVECGDSRTLRRINDALGLETVAARDPGELARLAVSASASSPTPEPGPSDPSPLVRS